MSGENTDPRVEPGIGRSLERARKSRGLSLWQVEQQTRIRSRYLHDLERENFDVLPAVYVLGSLKTYADFLGLDGAALSRQLKVSLVEPAEPDVPEQLATLGETRDEEDEYEAAPVPAVGFDQLFLGMGVILVSILAVMTIVAAVAQGDESPVSQINQPSTPASPSEIALAGNVEEDVKRAGDDEPVEDEDKQDKPEAPKDDEAGDEESKDEGEKDDGDASRSASFFDDAEFVPTSPSSSPTTGASASASPASASPALASPASASPALASPASASPTAAGSASSTAEPDDVPASTASASTGASPEPAREAPDAAAPAPTPAGGGSPQAGGGGGGQTAPAGEADSDLISAETDRKVDAALDEAGIDR